MILDLDDLERAHSKIFQWPSLSLSNADPSQPNANPTPLVGLEPSFFDLNFYFRGGKQQTGQSLSTFYTHHVHVCSVKQIQIESKGQLRFESFINPLECPYRRHLYSWKEIQGGILLMVATGIVEQRNCRANPAMRNPTSTNDRSKHEWQE